jgi:hypothetical protein
VVRPDHPEETIPHHTEYGSLPRIESYFSTWASVALSVMSFTAAISISVLPARR